MTIYKGNKLNLGCGTDIMPNDGWINIDLVSDNPDVVILDVSKLPESNEVLFSEITYIKAHNLFQYVDNVDTVLKYLKGICSTGATIDIVISEHDLEKFSQWFPLDLEGFEVTVQDGEMYGNLHMKLVVTG